MTVPTDADGDVGPDASTVAGIALADALRATGRIEPGAGAGPRSPQDVPTGTR